MTDDATLKKKKEKETSENVNATNVEDDEVFLRTK